MTKRLSVGIAIIAIAFVACGDDDSPSGTDAGPLPVPPPSRDSGPMVPMDGGPPPADDGATPPPDDGAMPPPADGGLTDPLDDFCMRGAMIECTGNQRCCSMPFASVEACVTVRVPSCRVELMRVFEMNPGLHIDPARTMAFYDFLQGIADHCAGPAPDFGQLPVAGAVPEGGDCIGTGTASDLSLFKCAEGLACSIDSAGRSARCAPRPATGEPCTSPYMCPPTDYCTANFDVMPFTAGTCVPLVADGMPCTSDYQCLGGACEMSVCAPLAQTFCFSA